MKALETQSPHEADLVGGHGSERIIRSIGEALWFGGIAIPAKIGAYDGVVRCQLRRNPGPHRSALWKAMEKQHRWPGAAHDIGDVSAIDIGVPAGETFEHGVSE